MKDLPAPHRSQARGGALRGGRPLVTAAPRLRLRSERGGAVVEFVMVSVLLLTLLLAVLQVAVYVHVRNVVAASAQEGARFAANSDVAVAEGAGRTTELVGAALSERTAEGLVCSADQEVDDPDLTVVVVRCHGAVPTLLSGLGDLLPVEVTGRAVREGA